MALARAGADVVGVDIAAEVSPILDFAPATPGDLAESGRLVREADVRWAEYVADHRDIPQVQQVAESVRAIQTGAGDGGRQRQRHRLTALSATAASSGP